MLLVTLLFLGNKEEKIKRGADINLSCQLNEGPAARKRLNYLNCLCSFYRSQRSCEGYVFTPVYHSVHRGVSASVHAGTPPPWKTHTPRKHTPPFKKNFFCFFFCFILNFFPNFQNFFKIIFQFLINYCIICSHPPREMAVTADSTHPTGMHSCFSWFSVIKCKCFLCKVF